MSTPDPHFGARFLAHFICGHGFTHARGEYKEIVRLKAETIEEAREEACTLALSYRWEQMMSWQVSSLCIYEVSAIIPVDFDAWQKAKRETDERAAYERLKAKYEGEAIIPETKEIAEAVGQQKLSS